MITTDAFTEWFHFRIDQISPDQIGAKALTATVSDCAAMGCQPLWVTVALAVPADTSAERVEGIALGMKEAAERYGCDIVGGDTIQAMSDLSLSLTAVGAPFGERVLLRSGARVGDELWVTGSLGGARAGQLLLEKAPRLTLEKEFRESVLRFLQPEARISVARILATAYPVTSMIDLSDGLSVDAHHLARESGVGIRIEKKKIPTLSSAQKVVGALGIDPVELALNSGEEFELLFTLPPGEGKDLPARIQKEAALPVTRIGVVVPAEEGVALADKDGNRTPLVEAGYEHFRPPGEE